MYLSFGKLHDFDDVFGRGVAMKLQVLFCLEAWMMITDGRRSRSLFTLLNRSRSVHSLARSNTHDRDPAVVGSYLDVG